MRALRRKRAKRETYTVHPRYSCGSPALVDEKTAYRVARHEWAAYQEALRDGSTRAKAIGARRIVQRLHERRAGWVAYDLVTGETYAWPRYESFGTRGWREYVELTQAQAAWLWRRRPEWAEEARSRGREWFRPCDDEEQRALEALGGNELRWIEPGLERWEPEILRCDGGSAAARGRVQA